MNSLALRADPRLVDVGRGAHDAVGDHAGVGDADAVRSSRNRGRRRRWSWRPRRGWPAAGSASLNRSPISWPVSRSTMPPLTPLPPTSMPNPRRCEPPLDSAAGIGGGHGAPRRGWRCDALHTLVARGLLWWRAGATGERHCAAIERVTDSTSIRPSCAPSPNGWRPRRRQFVAAPSRGGVRRRTAARIRRSAVRAKSTPDRPGHHRRHRDRARCCATGWPNCGPVSTVLGEEGGGPTRRRPPTAVDLGARPDRRHGQLRLRACPPTRCRWPSRSTDCRWPVRSPTSSTGAVYSAALGPWARTCVATARRRRCAAADVDELSMALVGTGFGYAPRAAASAGGGARRAAAGGARHAADRVGGARSVHGRRGPAGRVLRGRRSTCGTGPPAR